MYFIKNILLEFFKNFTNSHVTASEKIYRGAFLKTYLADCSVTHNLYQSRCFHELENFVQQLRHNMRRRIQSSFLILWNIVIAIMLTS